MDNPRLLLDLDQGPTPLLLDAPKDWMEQEPSNASPSDGKTIVLLDHERCRCPQPSHSFLAIRQGFCMDTIHDGEAEDLPWVSSSRGCLEDIANIIRERLGLNQGEFFRIFHQLLSLVTILKAEAFWEGGVDANMSWNAFWCIVWAWKVEKVAAKWGIPKQLLREGSLENLQASGGGHLSDIVDWAWDETWDGPKMRRPTWCGPNGSMTVVFSSAEPPSEEERDDVVEPDPGGSEADLRGLEEEPPTTRRTPTHRSQLSRGACAEYRSFSQGRTDRAEAGAVGAAAAIELVMGDVVILAGPDFDAAHLRRLIRIVRSAASVVDYPEPPSPLEDDGEGGGVEEPGRLKGISKRANGHSRRCLGNGQCSIGCVGNVRKRPRRNSDEFSGQASSPSVSAVANRSDTVQPNDPERPSPLEDEGEWSKVGEVEE